MNVSVGLNLGQVQERIASAALRAGRAPSDVLLVAVTKTHGPELVSQAYEAGLRHFGENRVEEAKDKIAACRQILPSDVVWHMIGHIQSRKTADVVQLFDRVHSVDRLKIARRMNDALLESGHTLDVLLEVNVSGEDSKYGYALSGWPDDQAVLGAFLDEVETILSLPGLRCRGLMTMAPFTLEPEQTRPVFRRMRLLREELQRRFPAQDWPHLSMGMSGDFEVAIEEGATIVRIGSAIFGAREW